MQEKLIMIAVLVLLVLTLLSTLLYWWNLPLAKKKMFWTYTWKISAKYDSHIFSDKLFIFMETLLILYFLKSLRI